ncbi:terminase [Clostridium tetani]|uniref:terminase n=1 Tax=Clostridium tetani TaxID=1513 RepID=UPI001FB15648|nr:terminase [Clostridium tetani]
MQIVYYDNKEFTQAEYNTYILFKYLSKHYSKDIATKIIKQNQDKLSDIAIALGEKDIAFFCLYFLQDTFVPKSDNQARNLAPVHLEIWEELNKMFYEDLYDREEFILPRGCSKTTIINKALSCYSHCYKKSRYTIVIGNKESDAEQFIADTRKMLENPIITKAFGKLIDRRNRTVNKQEIELTNNTKIQAFSWGSSVRGTTYGCKDGIFRPSCVLCDDVLSEDDILSDNAKEKVLNKYYKEIVEVGDTEVVRKGKKIKSGTKFLIIGTPLATDCFINTVKEDTTFKVFHRKVVDFDIDDYFENNKHWQYYEKILQNTKINKEDKDIMLKEYYSENKKEMEFTTIWEKYNCDELAQKYFTKRTAFMQELMCDCKNIGEKWFKSVRTQPKEQVEDNVFIKTMLCVDPASTTKAKSDYTAMVVGSVAENGFKYMRELILDKLNFDNYCKKVVELIKLYEDITHVYIEKNTYQGADLIKIKELIESDKELQGREIEFINEMQKKNKDNKISSIVDSVNSGQVIFVDNNKEFTQQILDFSGQKYSIHDDGADTTAECVIRLDTIEVVGKLQIFDRRLFF